MDGIFLINGNANRLPLADASVHMVVTSPPYWGLRDYGLPPRIWCDDTVCEHVWGEGIKGRKKGGGVGTWDVGYHQSDDVHFVMDGGKFCQLCGAWFGGLGLEPTIELFIKHMVGIFREVGRVLRPDGTLWLNMGDCYASQPNGKRQTVDDRTFRDKPFNTIGNGLKNKDLVGMPWRLALALQTDGWYLRSDIIWSKPNPMPESVRDRPTKAHEYLFLLAKSPRYFYDLDAIKQPVIRVEGIRDRRHGKYHNEGTELNSHTGLEKSYIKSNKRSVWTVPPKPYKGAHFATFPPDLIKPCIMAGTSSGGVCDMCGAPFQRDVEKGEPSMMQANKVNGYDGASGWSNGNQYSTLHMGRSRITHGWMPSCDCGGNAIPATVLDPFVGSGTTLQVAHELGRNGIGVDLSWQYLTNEARKRLDVCRQIRLF